MAIYDTLLTKDVLVETASGDVIFGELHEAEGDYVAINNPNTLANAQFNLAHFAEYGSAGAVYTDSTLRTVVRRPTSVKQMRAAALSAIAAGRLDGEGNPWVPGTPRGVAWR